jgi:prolyl oligopeptidase
VHLLDRTTGTWRTLVEGVDAISRFSFAELRLVGTTTIDAPRGRVVATSFHDVTAWSTLVPEGDEVIDEARPVGSAVLVRTIAHGVARMRHYDGDGTPFGEVALPDVASFAGFDAHWHHPFAFCQLEGFTQPATLYRWQPGDGLHPWTQPVGDVEHGRFAVQHERYTSTDGTSVGLFVVHHADVVPNPNTPCILTGYGGFAISETPAWSPVAAAWCEAGGLFAVAGLRGGLEEGEAWHRAGRREHKQNVFDDFRAAAAALLISGRTSPSRLAFRGGSNGGLLVGAALTQWPDLARAVHCAVPLLDMIRFPQFRIARLWTDEYGNPDVADEFPWLWSYSPYHRVREGACYPAVLLTTAEGDSRVDPMHARKMAAALQWASRCQDERPVLLRQEDRAGHGQGKPLHKQADEAADVLAFFSWQLGAPVLAHPTTP